MHISLIVTTYNRPDALELVLKSIQYQSLQPFEVIIADDGSNNKTKEVITNFIIKTKLNIKHSFQEDLGFRAAKSRNKAIALAKGDYIILIDGDMILHPEFIKDHASNAKNGFFIQGSRVLFPKDMTNHIIKTNHFKFNFFHIGVSNRLNSVHSRFLSRIFSIKRNYLKGVKTCNMSFYLKDFISINGFNNDFEGWGREDSEFVARLLNKGVNRNTLKFSAIHFHLWHNENNREFLIKNNLLLQKTLDEKLKWCESGVNSFL